jgi:hypothetical protein
MHPIMYRPWKRFSTPLERLAEESYTGSGTEEDPYIVDWLRNDLEDPQQWPYWYRWLTIAIVSFTTLAVALSSSAYSGGIESLVAEFQVSTELLVGGGERLTGMRTDSVSLFVVGFAFGPLQVASTHPLFLV